jgi:hypothetical protein
MRQHAALFGSILGVTAILAGLGTALIGYLGIALDNGVRSSLAGESGQDGALRVTLDLGDDPADQDRRFESAVASQFGDRGRLPLELIRRETASQTADLLVSGDTEVLEARLATFPDLEAHAELIDGRWPANPGEVSMSASAAAFAGLVPGDRIELGGASFDLAGTWRVSDALDPRWFGDTMLGTGRDGRGAIGPVAISSEAWGDICIALGDSGERCVGHDADWVLVPASDVSVDDLPRIVAGWDGMREALETEFGDFGRLDGGLADTAATLASRAEAVRAVTPVALLLLGAIGVVTLAELARLLGAIRTEETALLRSRGASRRRIVLTAAVEAALVSALGALIGATAGVVVVSVIAGTVDAAAIATAALVATAVGVATTGLAALVAWLSARTALRRDTLHDTGRRRAVAGGGLVALVALAAAVAVWQFLLYGSPLTPAPGGGSQIDPVAVLAPALALVAVVLLALLVLPAVATALARGAGAGTGIAAPLAARSAARRIQVAATPVVLVGLACGQLAVAAAYAGTWTTAYQQTSEIRLGAPVTIETPAGGLTDQTLGDLRGVDGLGAVAPVLVGDASFGGEPMAAVAATATTLTTVADDAGGLFDGVAAAAVTGVESPGPEIPVGTETVELAVTALGFDEAPAIGIRLLDALGAMHSLDLPAPEGTEGSWTYRAEIEPSDIGPGPWRIAALDVTLPEAVVPRAAELAVDAISVDGASVDLGLRWSVAAPETKMTSRPIVIDNTPGFRVARGVEAGGILRLLPISPDRGTGLTIAQVVVSQPLADAFGLAPGRLLTLNLPFADDDVNATVGLVVPAIPGTSTGAAVLIDLGWVRVLELRSHLEPEGPAHAWAAPEDPVAAIAAVRRELPADARIRSAAEDPVGTMLASAAVVLVAGAAGTAILALVALATVAGALLRARAGDVVLLRALGLTRRAQARIRGVELAAIALFGGVAGVAAGAIVSVLTVSPLARAAVPDPYPHIPTVLLADPSTLGVGFGALVLGIAAVVVAYAARVATQARVLSAREELR